MMALTAAEIRERDRAARSASIRRTELGVDLQVRLEDLERAVRALRLFVRDEVMPAVAR